MPPRQFRPASAAETLAAGTGGSAPPAASDPPAGRDAIRDRPSSPPRP